MSGFFFFFSRGTLRASSYNVMCGSGFSEGTPKKAMISVQDISRMAENFLILAIIFLSF